MTCEPSSILSHGSSYQPLKGSNESLDQPLPKSIATSQKYHLDTLTYSEMLCVQQTKHLSSTPMELTRAVTSVVKSVEFKEKPLQYIIDHGANIDPLQRKILLQMLKDAFSSLPVKLDQELQELDKIFP